MRATFAAMVTLAAVLVVLQAAAQDETSTKPGDTSDSSSEALKRDAIKALMGDTAAKPKPSDSGKRSTKPATRRGERRGESATDAEPSEPTRSRSSSSSSSSGSRSRQSDDVDASESVPLVPATAANSAATAPANEAGATPDNVSAGNAASSTTSGSATPDGYRTPPPDGDQPLRPSAENTADTNAETGPPTSGSASSSAIIIGLILLAVLLVALAAVIGVMAANKPGGGGTSEVELPATPPAPDWGYLSAPEAPQISLQHTPFVIGSAEECALRLADPKAAPHHARIDRTDAGYTLADLHSQSGTFLNGQRVTTPVSLRPGDEIRMGDIVVHFEMSG